GHSGGITVSTLAEAEYFAARGFADITYAVCMIPAKLGRAAQLIDGGAQLTLITDSAAVAAELAGRADALGVRLRLLIEIDSGEHRTGVAWDSDELVAIAACVHGAPALDLAGVLTHGGHAYGCDSIAAVTAVAEDERRAVVAAAKRLREAGYPCPTVSAGSTPTAVHAQSFAGLTEIRPGVYTFFDLAQVGLGSCQVSDIAISVLSTVISHQPEHGRLVIDAGGLALSKDISASRTLPETGYGWVCDPSTTQRIGDLRVAVADQEHGYVEGSDIPYDRLPIGSLVRVLPNHACMTAAAYDRYAVVDGRPLRDDEPPITAWWDRANGW
ncbi:MAG: alanine racemase, partial [Myxococcota bacterium]